MIILLMIVILLWTVLARDFCDATEALVYRLSGGNAVADVVGFLIYAGLYGGGVLAAILTYAHHLW
jgi:hypothetical protein